MLRPLTRAIAGALAGALAAAGLLAAAGRLSPGITVPLSHQVPGVMSGFHAPESSGDRWFAWTGPSATIRLRGLDRDAAWRCTVSLRGARRPEAVQPDVAIAVDGRVSAALKATNEFRDLVVDVGAGGHDGLVLTISSGPTFVPGPSDRRQLGVQVNGISCAPTTAALPPAEALWAAAATGAVFGALFVALGASLPLAIGAVTAIALAQAAALATGPAMFTPYVDRLPQAALWPSLVAAAVGVGLRAAGRPVDATSRTALAVAAAGMFVILLALLHPLKDVVDALFHAHRLGWVRGGRYLFTQPMSQGVAFPYAIALYVVSLPWAQMTRDHIALLRIVVTAAHLIAGLTLVAAIRRRWRDGSAAVVALLLLLLVPHWYVVVGNANLTAAFGQSAATIALMCAATPAFDRRSAAAVALLFAATSMAFLSHVGTFPTLAVTLAVLGVLCLLTPDRGERRAGWTIGTVAVAAAVLSVVIYYGRFAEVYQSIDRVLGRAPAAIETTAAAPPVRTFPGWFPRGGPTPSAIRRAMTAADVAGDAVGWPILALAVIGGASLIRSRARDRLTLAVTASLATCVVFVGFSVLTPVEDRFYRYNVEFIGRVIFGTWPVIVALAGLGAARAWRHGRLARGAAALLVAAAAWLGASSWWSWIT